MPEENLSLRNVTAEKAKYEDIHFVDSTRPVWNYSLFTEQDIINYQNGTHYRLYEHFGSHYREVLNTPGYYFAVWAPNATYISVIGDFNHWDKHSHPLFVRLDRSEEHTSELQSPCNLVCLLLLEK